jgi:hypothetical protein
MEEAKITGMTPPGIHPQGQMRGLPAHYFSAHHAFGVLHWDTALTALHIDDEGHHQDHDANQQDHRRRGEGAPGIGADFVVKIDHRPRQTDHDAGKDQERHPVAHAAFRDLLAQPHDENAARGQGQHGHQNERIAGVNDKISAALQLPGDTERLHCAQNQRSDSGSTG